MSRSSTVTVPAPARSIAPTMCSSVDFPEPLGPVTATVVPAGMSRLTWSTAVIQPSPVGNRLVSVSIRTVAPSLIGTPRRRSSALLGEQPGHRQPAGQEGRYQRRRGGEQQAGGSGRQAGGPEPAGYPAGERGHDTE